MRLQGGQRSQTGFTRRHALSGMAAAAAVVVGGRVLSARASDSVMRLGFAADPAGFDPSKGPSGMSHIVIEQVYSTLLSLDAAAQPQPDLAQGYEVADDGLSYTFHLLDGVRFHNGDPLTAEDVKFTFDRLREAASAYAYFAQVEAIKEVTVIDRLTVAFRLSAPTGAFLTHMAFPGSSIVPKRLVEAGHDLNTNPVGSGPFRFVSYTPRTSIRLSRNDAFYDAGKPHIAGVIFEIISDPTALTQALLSEDIDFSNEIPPKDWSEIGLATHLVKSALEGSRYYWLVPNNARAPLNDRRVRQAIAHAIDRQAITEGVFFGQAKPLLGGVIPEWSWAYPDLAGLAPRGSIQKAKQLLDQAGLEHGFETSLTVASSFPAMVAMAPIIQANLAEVGIKLDIRTVEVPRFWDEVWGPSNFDLTAMYWVSPLADPDDFVFNNYACGTPINVQKSCSAEMDALLRQGKSALSQEARRTAYYRQQELALVEMPIVPLINGFVLTAHRQRVKNFVPMRTGFLKSLRDVRLEG